ALEGEPERRARHVPAACRVGTAGSGRPLRREAARNRRREGRFAVRQGPLGSRRPAALRSARQSARSITSVVRFEFQQLTHLWLFFAPSFSSSASASGHGWMRWTGPFAMSAVVRPSRLTAFTFAPFDTRY